MPLEIVPITISDANFLVRQWHRHHPPTAGGLFAVAVATENERICGVALIGRPVARLNQDGFTAEVNRVATDGTKNACSMLYGAAWRVCKEMGYRRLVTYTMEGESGASLRGAGWTLIAERKGRSWNCKSRPRVDKHPLQKKFLWQRVA